MSYSHDKLEVAVEEALEKVLNAIIEHEEEAHDGGYCLGERANIVAAFAVILGIPKQLIPLILKQADEMQKSLHHGHRPGLN